MTGISKLGGGEKRVAIYILVFAVIVALFVVVLLQIKYTIIKSYIVSFINTVLFGVILIVYIIEKRTVEQILFIVYCAVIWLILGGIAFLRSKKSPSVK